jgi:hypothetical protein
MSQKNNSQGKNKRGGGGSTPTAPKTAQINAAISDGKETSAMAQAAAKAADSEGVERPEVRQVDNQPPTGPIERAMMVAYEQHQTFSKTYQDALDAMDKREKQRTEAHDAALASIEKEKLKLADDRVSVDTREAALAPREADLARARDAVAQREAEVASRWTQLDARELELGRRESDLAAGRLAAAFETYVAPLEQRRADIFEGFVADVARAQDEGREVLSRLHAEATAQNEAAAQRHRALLAELDVARHELELERGAIAVERARLERLERLLNDRRDSLLEEAQAEAEEARALLDIERTAFNETVRKRGREIDRVLRKSALVESWERELGDIEGVARRLAEAEEERARLEEELSRRSTLLQTVDVRRLERERTAFAERVEQLNAEVSRLDAEVAGQRTELLNAQVALDTVETRNATIEKYQAIVAELRGQMKHMDDTGKALTPFRECTRMDSDSVLQKRPRLLPDETLDLSVFIDRVQSGLYQDKQLSYRKRDLRLFVAGLAMSRLHILEGVSGTGKTTMPIAFARYIGGGAENVAIQAGWRDRQDLLGYFNEFQGHFRESEFLRGVYRAMTPAHADGVFFVVLDEMNLSKVEQYFADYLKGLEDAEGADLEQAGSVPLMDRSDIPLPKHLPAGKSGGVVLPLPPNVWFIGTANQDETTQSFAPKTQSRAHIMELPHAKPSDREILAEIGRSPQRNFGGDTVPYRLLRDAFVAAQELSQHKEAVTTATRAFEDINDALVSMDASLSLAPRFYRQLEAFVPVLLAAGGNLGLAVDHLVCSKVIRRMNERYNIRAAEKADFDAKLATLWGDLALGSYTNSNAKAMLSARSTR